MVTETARRRLLAKYKIQTQPADFDDVAIIEARRSLNRFGVHGRRSVARPDVVAVVALINLRGDIGLEPALQAHGGHLGFADDRQLVSDDVFPLVGVAAQNNKRWYLEPARELRALAHSRSLLHHLAARLGI